MINTAPSLDSHLKVHGLTMASFNGKSVDAALNMVGLSDRALNGLGDAHRERGLTLRGALLDRLAEKLPDDGGSGEPNPDDPDDIGDELQPGDDAPVKKNKKTKKATDKKPITDEEEEMPAKPDDPHPEGSAEYWQGVKAHAAAAVAAYDRVRGVTSDDPYWRHVNASVAAISALTKYAVARLSQPWNYRRRAGTLSSRGKMSTTRIIGFS